MRSEIITSAAFRVVEELGGRKYTLRPPTFGEAGELAARMVGTIRPGPAMVAETIRQALEATLEDPAERAEAVAAISAHEEADDYVAAVLMTKPEETEPPSAKAEWRASLAEAQRRLFAAERRKARAEAAVADHPAVVRIRAAQLEASLAERLHTVRTCLAGWEGPGLPAWCPDAEGRIPLAVLETLPAAEIAALAERCGELTRPSKAAEKN